MEFLSHLFDPSGFVPRRLCGAWTEGLVLLHNVSDALIWLAYMAIPCLLVYFVRRRRDTPFPVLFWLFGAFIVSCGFTHLLEVIIFYSPLYRLAGLVKAVTAAASWATVLALLPVLPRAMAFRSPAELEREVAARTAELARANAALEREVAERLRIEQALREERERFRLTLASIGDGVLATDARGRVTFLNGVATALTGWAEQEALGRPAEEVFRVVAEPDGRSAEAPAYRALREGRPVPLSNSAVLMARDGTGRPIDSCAAPIGGPTGATGAVLVFRDVGERRRAAESLRRSERRYRSLVTATSQIVWTTDPRGGRLTVLGGEDFVSRPEERLTRLSWNEITHPDDRGALDAAWAGALARRRPFEAHARLRRVDGQWRHVTIRGAPVLGDGGAVEEWVGVTIDVTEHRRLEEQYRQSQKMEAVGLLAAGVAHDFNNFLTIIGGYGELLLRSLPAADPGQESVLTILKAAERAAGLTRQLLAFGRRSVLAPRLLDLNTVVIDTERMLRRVIGADVALATSLQPDLGLVKADPGQVEQVILNLVVNARDAMPQGGHLTIETQNVELDDEYVRAHPDARPGPHVQLSVSDTGHGMAPEVKARIFEPFFTTKGPGKGTGLGLATVYGIVKQGGGSVEVYSEPGVGTTFKVYLPRVWEAESATSAGPGPGPAPGGNETVLLVEDEEGVRRLARLALEDRGYAVLEAGEAEEALRLAGAHSGPIHLLVTDVVMPGLGGRRLAERLLAGHPEMRVLYVSGYTDDAVVRHGVLEAQSHFLQKPFSTRGLAEKVREVLDSAK